MTAAPSGSRPSPADARALLGVTIILGVVALRCLSPFDPFPYWSGDPLEAPAPTVGLTPAISVALDMLTALGAAIACTAMSVTELKRAAWGFGACTLGMAAMLLHARAANGLDNYVYGSTLLSAFVGASAVFALATRTRVRNVVLAVLLGLLAMLAVRAIQQVYVEHPRTLETFRATREQFFRAQGWTPDSPMAKAFERRLLQPEASGYFGMANVLSTLGAAGLGLTIGLAFAALRLRRTKAARPPATAPLALLLTGCAGLVYLAGAKGGIAASAIAVGAAAAGLAAARIAFTIPPRAARFLAPAVVLAALGAVITRGLIGERIQELSILFRWYYMQAAARIFTQHPLTGVGPMSFKNAYLLAKNPLSPEEVTSPHSILLDLLATLGIAGAALAVFWVFLASLGASGLLPTRADTNAAAPETPAPHDDWKPAALVLTLATIGAVFLERDGATPDAALTRLVGAALAVWTSSAVCRVMRAASTAPEARAAVSIGLSAAVLAAAAHCQIELTGITAGASAWCLLLFAVAAAWNSPTPSTSPAPTLKQAAVALAVIAAFVGAGWGTARRVYAWQSALADAYSGTEPVAELSARRNALASGGKAPGFESDSPDALARHLAALTSTPVDTTPRSIDRALATLRLTEATRAWGAMPQAHGPQTLPHFPTLRARTRLALIQAESHAGLNAPERARAAIAAGSTELDAAQPDLKNLATYWAWIGTYQEAAAETESRLGGSDAPSRALEHTRRSLQAWEQAHALGPYELLPAHKALTAAEALSDQPAAQHWATECLRINELLRLDPLEQLSTADAAHCKSLVDNH